MARMLVRFAGALLLLLLLFYAADWAVWRVRLKHGDGWGAVTVTQVSVAPLKGSKEEYYLDGTDTLPCTRSIFPPLTAGAPGTPCWWLQRHAQQVMRY